MLLHSPEFGSQHPHGSLQQPINPVSGDPTPFSGFHRHYIQVVLRHTYKQDTNTHKKKQIFKIYYCYCYYYYYCVLGGVCTCAYYRTNACRSHRRTLWPLLGLWLLNSNCHASSTCWAISPSYQPSLHILIELPASALGDMLKRLSYSHHLFVGFLIPIVDDVPTLLVPYNVRGRKSVSPQKAFPSAFPPIPHLALPHHSEHLMSLLWCLLCLEIMLPLLSPGFPGTASSVSLLSDM